MFHRGDLSVKGETGSVKGETISANFRQGKVQIYRDNGDVTSVSLLPSDYFRLTTSVSLSLSLSLSPSLRLHLTHNIGSASALPIINKKQNQIKLLQISHCSKTPLMLLQHGSCQNETHLTEACLKVRPVSAYYRKRGSASYCA